MYPLTQIFVQQWNTIVPTAEDLVLYGSADEELAKELIEEFTLVYQAPNGGNPHFTNEIEELICCTNIAGASFCSISFLLEIETRANLLYFANYNENTPIFIDLSTGEILAKDLGWEDWEDENSNIKVAKDIDAFLRSFLLYMKVDITKRIKNSNPTLQEVGQIYELAGGTEYKELYELLLIQLKNFERS